MATGRAKTGGRRKGGLNKATLARQRAILEAEADGTFRHFRGDAHALLISIYKCADLPLELRIDAARAAIGYEKPKIAPVQQASEPEAVEGKALRLHQLLAEMRATIGGDRSNGHSLA